MPAARRLKKAAAPKTDWRDWFKQNEITLSIVVGCIALIIKFIIYFYPPDLAEIAADNPVKPQPAVVFSRTVTAADRDQHGNIQVFAGMSGSGPATLSK